MLWSLGDLQRSGCRSFARRLSGSWKWHSQPYYPGQRPAKKQGYVSRTKPVLAPPLFYLPLASAISFQQNSCSRQRIGGQRAHNAQNRPWLSQKEPWGRVCSQGSTPSPKAGGRGENCQCPLTSPASPFGRFHILPRVTEKEAWKEGGTHNLPWITAIGTGFFTFLEVSKVKNMHRKRQ